MFIFTFHATTLFICSPPLQRGLQCDEAATVPKLRSKALFKIHTPRATLSPGNAPQIKYSNMLKEYISLDMLSPGKMFFLQFVMVLQVGIITES